MSHSRITTQLALVLALGAGVLTGTPQAAAGPLGLFDSCCPGFCHRYTHCQEGPPWVHIKIGCSKPICDPCTLEHFGYYRTCWQPWPYPPDWSHCAVPPGTPSPWMEQAARPTIPEKDTGKTLPPPRKMEDETPIRPLGYSN